MVQKNGQTWFFVLTFHYLCFFEETDGGFGPCDVVLAAASFYDLPMNMKSNKSDYTPVFHRRIPIQIRFNDVDRYGHVNNNAYFAFYDLGKEDYLQHVFCRDFRSQEVVPVIANIDADFISPIFLGDPIEVETAIVRLGKKSFTLLQRAVNTSTGAEVCRCTTVMVCFNLHTQQSADIPQAYREAVLAFEHLSEK